MNISFWKFSFKHPGLGLPIAFLIGFLTIGAISLITQKFINDLDTQLVNERARLFIGEQIVESVHETERLFYKMAVQSGSNMHQNNQNQINTSADRLVHLLNVLQKGGVVQKEVALNLYGIDQMVRKVQFTPNIGHESSPNNLAVIELTPFIEQIRKHAQYATNLLTARDVCLDTSSYCRANIESEILIFYKLLPSFFFRLGENANRQYFESVSQLEHIEAEMDRQQSTLKNTQYLLIVAVVLAVLVLAGFYVHQIGESQEALEAAKEDAEAASLAKSSFLATMSHEIRTPLNGILGMAQVLTNPDLSQNQRLECIRVLLNSGHTLLGIINDILDLSKIEAAKMVLHIRPFAIRELEQEIVDIFKNVIESKNINFQRYLDVRLAEGYQGDPIRIKQMLSNLINNAIKFTSEGGQVQLSIQLDSEDQIVFSVTDNGIGIPPEKQDLLFEKFVQIDSSSTRAYGGTGLGLSIVKQMATLMGGNVGFISNPGEGSRFWFSLPLPPSVSLIDSATSATTTIDINHKSLESLKVLVAEDQPTNRLFISMLLKQLGFVADIFDNGSSALEAMRAKPYDIVLMDVQMPVMDGLTATKIWREYEIKNQLKRCPIIAVTANAYDNDKRHCLDAGMDDFLAKPFMSQELQSLLQKWLKITPHQPKIQHQTNTTQTLDLPNKANLEVLVSALIPLLTNQRFEALQYFEQLRIAVLHTSAETTMQSINKQLEQLNFGAAKETLEIWWNALPSS